MTKNLKNHVISFIITLLIFAALSYVGYHFGLRMTYLGY